jgi:TRAP-type C4-dicarboxylate transport system permease large subunit
MLAGSLMSYGGIAKRLFDLARVLVGHRTGGLAQVNVAMSVLNGGISGSSAADAALDCKVIIPQMRADGYPAAFSGAITAASGMLANIIPPSIAMLIYASLTNVSVGWTPFRALRQSSFVRATRSPASARYSLSQGFATRSKRQARRWLASVRSSVARRFPARRIN